MTKRREAESPGQGGLKAGAKRGAQVGGRGTIRRGRRTQPAQARGAGRRGNAPGVAPAAGGDSPRPKGGGTEPPPQAAAEGTHT